MVDPIPFRRPTNWKRLNANEAERIIHERAQDTGKVIIVGHPEERSQERGILALDIYRILRNGTVNDEPVLNKNGDWEAIIQMRMRGTRDAGAATIIVRADDTLIVKTVMWVDK